MGALDLPGLIQGEATSGLAWRSWLAGLRCHELSVPDWLPAHARLVIVAPHPDDEVLASGGLIATHVAQGGRVLIVAVTDGEASHDEAPSIQRDDLAWLRRSERWMGLRTLGVLHAAGPPALNDNPTGKLNIHALSTCSVIAVNSTFFLLFQADLCR